MLMVLPFLPLPDELCHDLSLQPNERFDVEAEDGVIIFKRLEAGYDIDQ